MKNLREMATESDKHVSCTVPNTISTAITATAIFNHNISPDPTAENKGPLGIYTPLPSLFNTKGELEPRCSIPRNPYGWGSASLLHLCLAYFSLPGMMEQVVEIKPEGSSGSTQKPVNWCVVQLRFVRNSYRSVVLGYLEPEAGSGVLSQLESGAGPKLARGQEIAATLRKVMESCARVGDGKKEKAKEEMKFINGEMKVGWENGIKGIWLYAGGWRE